MTKKRIVNIRILSVMFIGLMLGILFCYNYILNKFSTLQVVLIICSVIGFSLGAWLYAKFTEKKNLQSEYKKDVSHLISLSSISFLMFFVIGIIAMMVPLLTILNPKKYVDDVQVQGVVCDYVQDNSTYKKFLLKDCTIETSDNTYNTEFKIVIYTNKNASINVGDIVSFVGSLETYSFFRSIDRTKVLQKIMYKAYVDMEDMHITMGKKSLRDTIKNETFETLYKNLPSDNANIFYAILFGQKEGLSQDIKDMFSGAGISHILAVSGLHIGVLVSAIYFVLKKLKLNNIVSLILLGGILFMYSYLCSFTPSVCRASIMAMILSLSRILKRDYDPISSLSVAGIIILLFNPRSLFTVSFQLSFLCIFAIITLAPSITKLFDKIKFPKFISSALAISIATNIAILPVCQNVFCKVSLLGVLTNIIILPIFSVTYILLFAIVFLAVIISPLGVFLVIPNLFLQLIKTVADYMVSIDIGVFKVFFVSYWLLVAIIMLSLILQYLLVKNYIKGGLALALAILSVALFIGSAIPTNYENNNLIFVSKYGQNTCYYIEDNYVTMIGSNVKSNVVLNELKNLKIKKINTIIAYDLQLNDLANLKEICKDNFVENIYLPKKFEFNELALKIGNVKYFDDYLNLGNLSFRTINYLDNIIGVTFDCKFGKVLIPEIKLTLAESAFILDNYIDIDILYLNDETTKIDPMNFACKTVVYNTGNTISNGKNIGQIDIFEFTNRKNK